MEKVNFGYSLKNIPIPRRDAYMKSLIDKTHKFLKRMRWKAHFYDNPTTGERQETFGFNSEKSPPLVKDLLGFESDMYALIKGIEFKQHYGNRLQQKINKDIRDMRSSSCMFVQADKTTNIYKISPAFYNKLLNDNITSSYAKQTEELKGTIDAEAREVAEKLGIADRAEAIAKRDAYITLKDHKENFPNNPKCRLINPAKGEMGIVAKNLLQTINEKVRSATHVNQWRSTSTVIDWFNKITNKSRCKFIQLDIVEFYPSISHKLLADAIDFARGHTDINDDTYKIIMHARRSLLFCRNETWAKKDNSDFDVTMGAYDGAEVCELVGLFLLNRIQNDCKELELGLYRDDGLGITRDLPSQEAERLRQKLFNIFQSNNLKITVDCNMVQADFLDVTFNLQSGKFWPYRKPNSDPLYINKDSNHPATILKQLPEMIQSRLSATSCDAAEFDKIKSEYENALKSSGFDLKIHFNKPQTRKTRPRQRKVIWFNPPFNASVLTNVGKSFLSLISKHFPKNHRYNKIFTKQSVKLSYSCSPNVQSIIAQHNRKILSQYNTNLAAEVPNNQPMCNCRKLATCPLSGNCLMSAMIYKATVSSSAETKHYIGATEQTFKKRYPKHKEALSRRNSKSVTTLSTYVWSLKDKGDDPIVRWEIMKRCTPYVCGSRRCDTCLTEKLCILRANRDNCINQNSELMQKCRHSNKFKLVNVKV